MRWLALLSIRAYQRWISPYKGFCCAYHAHTGRASCSRLGYRAIRWRRLMPGLAILRQRLRLCGVVHRRHHGIAGLHHRAQRGVCDVGCDLPCHGGCDPPGPCDASDLGRVINCCDCGGCDWLGKGRRRNDGREKMLHIPPGTPFKDRRPGPGKQPDA